MKARLGADPEQLQRVRTGLPSRFSGLPSVLYPLGVLKDCQQNSVCEKQVWLGGRGVGLEQLLQATTWGKQGGLSGFPRSKYSTTE